MSYTATYGGHERVPGERHLRREHPLGLRKTYDDPEDAEGHGGARRWSFGVAAGALLVAGTFAAGALGLNGDSASLSTGAAPEHAPASPGNSSHTDIGGPAVAPPPSSDRDDRAADRSATKARPAPKAPVTAAPAPVADQRYLPPAGGSGGSGGTGNSGGSGGGTVTTPAPAPTPAPTPAPQPGLVEGVVDGVTDTVGGVLKPVTDTVGGVLSPVTGILSGGDQPAMTMINPVGDLLGS